MTIQSLNFYNLATIPVAQLYIISSVPIPQSRKDIYIMKALKIFLFSMSGLFALCLILAIVATRGMGEIKKLSFTDVDLSKIADGVYTGSYHKGRWTYDVSVTVANHSITSVKNTDTRMKGQEKLDNAIAAEILKRQSVKIDVVSGATVNTRAYQKAVETALHSAPR